MDAWMKVVVTVAVISVSGYLLVAKTDNEHARTSAMVLLTAVVVYWLRDELPGRVGSAALPPRVPLERKGHRHDLGQYQCGPMARRARKSGGSGSRGGRRRRP